MRPNRIRKPLKRKGRSKGSRKASRETTIETEMIFFKKSGTYVLKAGGQILQYGNGEAPITVTWGKPNRLIHLLDEYYGTMD